MEHVACAACGSSDFDVVLDKLAESERQHLDPLKYVLHVDNAPVNYRHVCCRCCGLVFINPRMTQEESIAYYRDHYRDTYRTAPEEANIDGYPFERSHLGVEIYNAVVRVDLLDRLGYLRAGIKTLDVGSSLGALPAYLSTRGARAEGVEVSPFGAFSKQLFGIDGIHRVAFEYFETDTRYDIVTLCDVLEHLADPRAALSRARRLLADDGVLLIEVPDIFKPHKPVMTFLSNAHLYTYSPNSLRNLLGRCGFEVRRLEYGGHCKNMRIVAAKTSLPVEPRHDTVADVSDALVRYAHAYQTWQRFLADKISYDEACEQLLKSVPSYSPVHFSQGNRLLGRKDYAGAEACFIRCIESDYNEEGLGFNPGNLHAIVALIAWHRGDFQRSRHFLNAAWKLAPGLYDFPFLSELKRRGLFDITGFVTQSGLFYPQMADLEIALEGCAVAAGGAR